MPVTTPLSPAMSTCAPPPTPRRASAACTCGSTRTVQTCGSRELPQVQAALALAAVWGGSFLFMRVAVPEFGPAALMELRVGLAALFLLPLVLWRGKPALIARHWKAILVVG
ncbi:EamA family transporter, partial [Bordetella bronchiseptica]|uniref:EamA family transporter n=1 Tax=Bordetella bronchiseptica TaxID=518 RepID=UPI001F2D9356